MVQEREHWRQVVSIEVIVGFLIKLIIKKMTRIHLQGIRGIMNREDGVCATVEELVSHFKQCVLIATSIRDG